MGVRWIEIDIVVGLAPAIFSNFRIKYQLLDWLFFVNEGPDNCSYFEIRNSIDEVGYSADACCMVHERLASTQTSYRYLQVQITDIQWYEILNLTTNYSWQRHNVRCVLNCINSYCTSGWNCWYCGPHPAPNSTIKEGEKGRNNYDSKFSVAWRATRVYQIALLWWFCN